MRKKARGQHAFGGKARNHRTQRRIGASRGHRGGATRFGNWQPSPARGTPSLARAPGRPSSPSRGGRAHSGGRGAGNSVRPARGCSKSNLRDRTPGEEPTKTEEGRRKAISNTEAGPDVLLCQQRPYGSTSTGRARLLLFAPPWARPLLRRVCLSREENAWVKKKNGLQEREREGPSILCFQKRRNLKEEGNEFTNLTLHQLTRTENSCLILLETFCYLHLLCLTFHCELHSFVNKFSHILDL